MKLPEALLDSLITVKSFDRQAFEKIHSSGEQVTSIRINPFKIQHPASLQSPAGRIPWAEYGFYLAERPSFTFDPLFHAGCYYVQEASSMFLEQSLKQTTDLSRPLKVLDLCAAPGGKSTHIHSLLSPQSLLVSNEVIRSRAYVLKDNIVKWGAENVIITNNDPKDFSRLENYFDVIVVDAPCSGSGLFRRDPEAIEEWSINNVQLCGQRQQRILADILPALKHGGTLIYSTCSYSPQEDEQVVQWMMNEFPLDYLPIMIDSDWGIVDTSSGYRFWPDKIKGEGFFIACFRKSGGETDAVIKNRKKPVLAEKKEIEIISNWVKPEGKQFIRHDSSVYGWPSALFADFSCILEMLRVVYSGILIGDLIRDKIIPDHALAMSKRVADTIQNVELEKEQAIKYLQRKDINVPEGKKGWQLASYQGHPLGWVNILANRVNNYYPKELRILKEN